MPDLIIKNFKGKYERVSEFDAPTVFSLENNDLLATYEGKLVKRLGYETASLNGQQFATTGLSGNIINFYELVTGRSSTSAPNEAVKYICQTDSSPGKIYWFNESTSTWTQIDNSLTDFRDADGTVQKCRFIEEDGIVRILAGNRSVNKPLWWGYTGARFANAISANAGTLSGIAASFLTNAVESNVDIPVLGDWLDGYDDYTIIPASEPSGVSWIAAIDGNDIPVGEYRSLYYKLAVQYDNKQYSPASKDLWSVGAIYVSGDNQYRIRLLFDITASGFNQRITGFKLYRSIVPTGSTAKGDYGEFKLFKTFGVNDDYGSFDTADRIWPYNTVSLVGTFNTATDQFKLDTTQADDDALANDLYNGALLLAKDKVTGTVYTCQIADTIFTDTANQYLEITDDTGITDARQFDLQIVSGWYKNGGTNYQYLIIDDLPFDALDENITMFDDLNISQESYTEVYPKFGAMVQGQAFYANAYHYNEQKEYIITYGMLNSDGLFSNDVHHVLNAFSPGFPVKGISSISNRLIIYGSDQISRGIIPLSNASTWSFEKLFDQYGLLSEQSLTNINGKDYFLATDWTIKEFDTVQRPRTISDGIYDTLHDAGDTSITYLENAQLFFMPKLNMLGLKLQTGAATYEFWGFDLRSEQGWFKFNWGDTIVGFFTSSQGKSFGYIANDLWELNKNTLDDGSTFTPSYMSSPIRKDTKSYNHLQYMTINYRSNSTLTFNIYLDGSGTAWASLTLPVKSTLGTYETQLPFGGQCRNFKFEITVPTAQLSTNTTLEIDEITFPVEASGG